MSEQVRPEQVTGALRRVRPGIYRVDAGPDGARITLTLDVSPAGRRNAAARIVAALADGGFEPAGEDPVEALLASEPVPVLRRG